MSAHLLQLDLQLTPGLRQLLTALAESSLHSAALGSQVIGGVLQDLLHQRPDTHTHTHTLCISKGSQSKVKPFGRAPPEAAAALLLLHGSGQVALGELCPRCAVAHPAVARKVVVSSQ